MREEAVLWTIAREAAENWRATRIRARGGARLLLGFFARSHHRYRDSDRRGFFFGREAMTGEVAASIKDMVGNTGAHAVQAMLAEHASLRGRRWTTGRKNDHYKPHKTVTRTSRQRTSTSGTSIS